MSDKLYVYGDSLMKATVPDEDFRYHFRIAELMPDGATEMEVGNRAKMGATIRKGQALVARDLERGEQGRWALIGVRQAFLADRDCSRMIAADGIHLTMEGYRRLYGTIGSWMKKNVL